MEGEGGRRPGPSAKLRLRGGFRAVRAPARGSGGLCARGGTGQGCVGGQRARLAGKE